MTIYINGTTGISGVDGSAGTPALIGSDADTGFFFSAGLIGASANGTAGRVPAVQIYRLNADLAGANVNTAQSVFGVGVTLAASTVYRFEASYFFNKTAGATSHTFGLGFGGTATTNNLLVNGTANWVNSTSSTIQVLSGGYEFATTSTANLVISTALANASTVFFARFTGTVSINAGGTFIPQYTLSAAPGGAYSTVAGSYFTIYPLSASGSNTSVGTWS